MVMLGKRMWKPMFRPNCARARMSGSGDMMILDNDARQFSAYTAYPPSSDCQRDRQRTVFRHQMSRIIDCAHVAQRVRRHGLTICIVVCTLKFMRKATKPVGGHSARRVRNGRSGNQITETGASPRGKIRLTMYLDMAAVEYFRSRT